MSAAGGQSVPGNERAETYLRLQVEAELRAALGLPRHRQARQRPLARVVSARRRLRRHRAVTRAVLRAQSSPTKGRSLLQRWVSRIWPSAAPAWHRARFGLWHLRAHARARLRRARREQAPPPAGASLDRVTGLAAAFASAGAVDEYTAESLVTDMRTALAARGLIDQDELLGGMPFSHPRRSSATARTGSLRAIPVGAVAQFEDKGRSGRVCLGTMLLDTDRADLTVSARFAPAASPAPHVNQTPWSDPRMAVFADCTATDDRGSSYDGSFSGGGDDEDWDGLLHFHPVPPATARWLDVTVPGATPVRVDLTVTPVSYAVTSVPLAADGLAERYVDRVCVELLQSGDVDGLADGEAANQAAAVAGLLLSGVLSDRSPALRRFAAVARRLRFGLPAALADVRPQALPADWLAMPDRSDRDDGPTGFIALAATLPEVDGAQCVVTGLRSEPDGATLQVHARGWPEPDHFSPPSLEPFTWTARDDVGGWYVTGPGGGSYSSGGRADMDLRLQPAIDPAARSLEIVLTGRTGQVSVTVPLDWKEGL
jgi:hypothetical protein